MVRTPVIFSDKLRDRLTFTKAFHLESEEHGLFALFEKKETKFKKCLPQSRSWSHHGKQSTFDLSTSLREKEKKSISASKSLSRNG